MDRIWQWAWDRYGARYTWVLYPIGFAVTLAVYLLLTLLIAAFEKSGHYVEVTAVTAGAALLFECMLASPRRRMRLAEQWAAGQEIDRATALEGTYSYARRLSSQKAWSTGVWAAVLSVVVGAIAGATGPRLLAELLDHHVADTGTHRLLAGALGRSG
jgi:hypothetical protein